MSVTFSDLSDREVELVAEALKGTTWLAVFRRVSKVCKGAAASVEEDEAALRRLNVDDLVQSVELVTWALDQGLPTQARLARTLRRCSPRWSPGDPEVATGQRPPVG